MPIDPSPLRRFEWKYCVSPQQAAELEDALRTRTVPDRFCAQAPDGIYPVLSLYYDTRDLRFYHERKDGVRVRRKLRVRNYGDDQFFLEIKRKINKKVVKERVSVAKSEVAGALDGVDPSVVMSGRAVGDLRTFERFRFNMKSLGLVPTMLIAYRRRALVGTVDPLRITFDSALRCRPQPELDALFEEHELRPFEARCVFEMKFADRPPRWLMGVVSEFGLRREPYSKYCEGIDCSGDAADLATAGARSEAQRS